MEILNSKKFIVFMLVLLVWTGLGFTSCSKSEYAQKQAPHETPDEMNAKITKDMEAMDKEQADKELTGPTDFTGIAEILGCMFAPDDCIPSKRKAEQEMDR
jgi:Na+/H+ antiporter NhaC